MLRARLQTNESIRDHRLAGNYVQHSNRARHIRGGTEGLRLHSCADQRGPCLNLGSRFNRLAYQYTDQYLHCVLNLHLSDYPSYAKVMRYQAVPC